MTSTQPTALELLREYTIQNKPIQLVKRKDDTDTAAAAAAAADKQDEEKVPVDAMSECTHILFTNNDLSFPRQTDTHIKKSAQDSNYTLDTLVFLVQRAQLDNSAYFKECREQHIDHVSIVDKRKILDYLTGKTEVSPVITTAADKRTREESVAHHPVKKQKPQHDETRQTVKRVIAHERELETRTSILQGSKPFEKLGELVKTTLFAPNGTAAATATTKNNSNKSSSQRTTSSASLTKPKQPKLSLEDKIPIIIVPAAPTAKLNLYNIKSFLQNEKFEDAQELRASGEKKPEQVTVERKRSNGQIVVYHVVDSVSHFKQSDWDRVCCVLASGQQWQFKGWKWEKPLDVFSNVKGFYPKWTSDKVTGPAADWAVHHLNIHRERRYMDKAAVVDFWQKLDSFNSKQKPFLNY